MALTGSSSKGAEHLLLASKVALVVMVPVAVVVVLGSSFDGT